MAATLTKRRAFLMLAIGVVVTWPGQLVLAAIGTTEMFADETTDVALRTYPWLIYTAVALGLGLAIAYGACVLLTRSLDHAVRARVRVRFIMALAVVVVLSALSAVEAVDVEAGGSPQLTGITPLMLIVWVVGSIALVRITVRASQVPLTADASPPDELVAG